MHKNRLREMFLKVKRGKGKREGRKEKAARAKEDRSETRLTV